jgi:hypothetical protein
VGPEAVIVGMLVRHGQKEYGGVAESANGDQSTKLTAAMPSNRMETKVM